jgi:hypothetical protein
VTEHLRDDLRVDAGLEERRRVGVAEIVEADGYEILAFGDLTDALKAGEEER